MDIKRNILWVIFGTSLFLLWDHWMVAQGNPSFFAPSKPVAGKSASANSDLPSAASGSAATANGKAAVPGAALPGASAANVVVKGETITITTDVVKADIDTLGGNLVRLELLKFKDGIDTHKNQVLFQQGGTKTYLAQSGLIGGTDFPNHKSLFVAKPGARTLESGNEVQLVLEAGQGGVKLVKTWIFKRGNYQIGLRHQLTNTGSSEISPSLYTQIVHDGNKPEGDTYFLSSYTGPVVFTESKKYEKLTFEEVEKHEKKKLALGVGKTLDPLHEVHADNGWVALVQHFFVAAILPTDKTTRDIYTEKVDTNLYRVGYTMPLGKLAPQATLASDLHLFAGPQVTSLLEQAAPGLDAVKDYGRLSIIAGPLFWIMDLIHGQLGNWGWTIIAFTILIKLAFFPLSAAGFRSMAKMKVVTPKMTAIRERYKDDPAKMNQAMMELYKTEKINPLGGCFPILIQMPVFLALYWVLQASVEIRNAPWVGWIHDLAAPDPYYILPVLYAISMFVTSKLNPPPADPMQAKMMLYMPLMFSVMFFFFPSGLVLYWVVNNLLSIAQQWVINNKIVTDKVDLSKK
jgi:YidC/Oxa1 family membrane protein insertase